jgi:hypothetical protein
MPSDSPSSLKAAGPSPAADEPARRLQEEIWDNDGGHVKATGWRVIRDPDDDLPYTVILTPETGAPVEQRFATMREAEDFIKQGTCLQGPTLSSAYDDYFGSPAERRDRSSGSGTADADEDIVVRLRAIDQRLRKISAEDAASVLADSMGSAGLHENDRLLLVKEIEQKLDERNS